MWTTDRELLATSTETQAALLHVYLKVNGAKNLGKPMRITRPWEREAKAKKIGMSEFAQMLKK